MHVGTHRVNEARSVLVRDDLGELKCLSEPVPALFFQSVGFTPEIVMRTRTSPGPGSVSLRSRNTSTEESPVCA